MVALSSDSSLKPLVEAIPEFLESQALDPVTTRLLRPGMEYQLWLDGRPKRIPVGRNTGDPMFGGELVRVEHLANRLGPVGLTGWNWQSKQTCFVILDFDAKDHAAGYVEEVLALVIAAAGRLGWCWLRRSKGGRGFHIIVVLSKPLPAETGTDHQVNSAAVVDRMCADAEFDFREYLDCAGVVGFVWAPQVAENAFEIIVEPICETPVIELSAPSANAGKEAESNDLPPVELSEQQQRDIKQMRDAGYVAHFADGRLSCHSRAFEVLYSDKRRPGSYSSKSAGKHPQDANAFAYPMDDGGWIVTRYGVTPAAETTCWYANAEGFATTRVHSPEDFGFDGPPQKPEGSGQDGKESDACEKKKAPKKKAGPSPSQMLLSIASENELCHTTERIPVIVMDRGGKRRTFILPDKEYEAILAKQLYDRRRIISQGKWLKDAMRLVEAKCLEGPCRTVFTRIGYCDGAIYLDLGDNSLRVVKITKEGWTIENRCPILFHRSPNVSAMPEPVRGGKVEELRPLLNIADADWPIVAAFLLACWNPYGPFPLLVLNGQAGAAKSTLARLIQGIVDSTFDEKRQREELFAPPKKPEDLMVFAIHSWLLCFDNLSVISASLSEALCRLSTGGATIARKLYTNSGMAKMSAQQPVILTAINDVVVAEDLRSRSLFLDMTLVDQDKIVGETTLQNDYISIRPRVMGALLDCVVCALNEFENFKPLPGNRLADLTRWVQAAESATGLEPGTFAKALSVNRRQAAEDALSSPLAEGIRKLAASNVRLKADEIRERLEELGVPDVPEAVSLGCKLKALATEMAAVGVLVKKDGRHWIIKLLAT